MTDEKNPTAREAAEAKRAMRKAELADKYDAQRATDLEAVIDLEEKHGDSRVKVLNVPFTPGLPTLIVVRCAQPVEIKRYRAQRMLDKKGNADLGAINTAAETLADLCVVYPDAETYARLREERPGIHAQAGMLAVKLAEGREDDEGKDS
jgi:hypothetical protein